MSFLREAWARELPGFSVGVFRILLGLMWLDLALQKAPWVIQDGRPFGWLYGWIWKEINHPTFSVYTAFLQAVVLPNYTLFGYMSFVTEVAIELSLLLCLFTVLGGVGGASWQLNIAFGSYQCRASGIGSGSCSSYLTWSLPTPAREGFLGWTSSC